MTSGLEREIVDRDGYGRNVAHLRALGVELPRIADLADPPSRLAAKAEEIAGVDPDRADARNLFRVHWHNGADRKSLVDTPEHIVLPDTLTGVQARIIVALGNRFPMINAHKVLAAYGCLIPRLLSGAFDVTRHRAVWPSTGNYCRGGVADRQAVGMPVGCGAAGGHEPGTLRLARGLGGRSGRHSPHAGHGKQRQGDLRCLSCPGKGRAEPDPQSVLGIRELHRAPRRHRTGAGADICGAQPGRNQDGARVHMRFRIGRDAGGRRPSQAFARHPNLRRRGVGMPDASLQRLWGAQHPGHRRQACAAHSQRHGLPIS